MIYLIRLSNDTSSRYWIITDTTGASLSTSTPQDAIAEFKRSVFDLTYGDNNYSITEHEVLSNGKSHGRILAKANTIQSLINNYPEYFI